MCHLGKKVSFTCVSNRAVFVEDVDLKSLLEIKIVQNQITNEMKNTKQIITNCKNQTTNKKNQKWETNNK